MVFQSEFCSVFQEAVKNSLVPAQTENASIQRKSSSEQAALLDSKAAEAAQDRTELRLKETALAAAQHDLLELQLQVIAVN